MNPRPWLAQYPPGLPDDLPATGYASLVELFESCCRRFGDLPALENLGTTLTYHQWNRLSLRLGHFFHRLGLTKGMRLAIMLPNLLQYPVVLVGALRAGLTVVNINPLFTPRELAQELADSQPEAIVLLENFAHVLARVPSHLHPRHVLVTRVGDLLPPPRRQLVNGWLKLRGRIPPYRLPRVLPLAPAFRSGRETPLPVRLDREDLALLQYTGGTTGTPKGAMLSHANLLANIEQARSWLTCSGWHRPMRPGREILITALPLYHIFAMTANLWVGLAVGVHNHLVTNPKDVKGLVRILKRSRFTCITGVNTLFDHLLHTPDFERLDFSNLRLTLAGGMPVQRHVAERWQALTGCPVIEGYGLTEASPVVTLNPLDIETFTGSIGLPLPGTDCCIRDDDRPVPPGQTGELCVKGPQVMRGYWNRPEETRTTFTADGWLRTGDIARMDQRGFLYIVDRRKDMILVSGFNVYPSEIEAVVSAHPGVRECAAVGVPDEHTGEAVKLFVVRSDSRLSEAELLSWCRDRLTAYKRPHSVEFREELPKSAVGKILRRQLKAETGLKP